MASELSEFSPIYSDSEVVRFAEAAEILIVKSQEPDVKICTVKPTFCPGRSASFLVNMEALSNWRDIYQDDYSPWGNASGASAHYRFEEGAIVRVDHQKGKMDGTFDYDWRITRVWYRHPAAQHLFQKSLFNAYFGRSKKPKYALVSYRWLCEPYPFDPLTPAEARADRRQSLETAAAAGSVAQPEEDAGRIILYSTEAIQTFADVANVFAFNLDDPESTCTTVPFSCEGNECTFLVDLSVLANWKDVFKDEYAPWGQSSGSRAYYIADDEEKSVRRVDEGGKLSSDRDYDWLIVRCYNKHAATGGKFTKSVYTAYRKGERQPGHALIVYKWLCEPFQFERVPAGAVIGRQTKGRFLQPQDLPMVNRLTEDYEVDVEGDDDEYLSPKPSPSVRVRKTERWGAGNQKFERKLAECQARIDNLDYENAALKNQLAQMEETNRDQKAEISYLRTILNNESQLAPLLRGVANIPGVKLSFDSEEKSGMKRGADGKPKRIKYTEAPTTDANAGLCLHVQDGDVSFEFCAKCSSRNSRPTSGFMVQSSSHYHPADEYNGSLSFAEAQEMQVAEVHVFSVEPITTFSDVAEIMAFRTEDPTVISNARPLVCPGKSSTFVVDLHQLPNWRDIFVDNYGSWGGASGSKAYFVIDQPNRRAYRVDNRCKIEPTTPFNLMIRRCAYKHQATGGNFHKSIYLGYRYNDPNPKWALVSYEWECEPFEFEPPPHGNAKKNLLPFQPTPNSVRQRVRELSTQMRPEEVFDQVVREQEGTADVPRDLRQASNIAYHTPHSLPSTSKRGRPRKHHRPQHRSDGRYEEGEDEQIEVEDDYGNVVYDVDDML